MALARARGEYEQVREYSEKLLRLQPGARVALEGLVSAAMPRSDYKAAVQHCGQLVKTAPDSFRRLV